jgi:hypothetical protein
MSRAPAGAAGDLQVRGEIMSITHHWVRRAPAFVVLVLVMAILSPGAGTAIAAAPDDECPEVVPVSEVTKGMLGTGYTVSEGTQPEPFSVEVLGVMRDAIGPGRDLIVIEAHSPAIDSVGGIWAGMSGSPVYDQSDRLIGAVAYSMSFGPSPIAGVTPAEDMVQILDYPGTSNDAAAAKVDLSPKLAGRVATRTGASQSESDSMSRLRTPLGVSGVSQRAFRKVGRAAERENLPFVPYATSSAAAGPSLDPNPLVPGSSFAAAISYGDVTMAGVGTTTLVCDSRALAFGHPFLNVAGPERFGANAADTLAIVDDEFGPYKLATVEGIVGRGDQDRFAGIRAVLGELPTTIPITTSVTTPARSRLGESDAVTSEFVPFVTFIHLISNFDMTRDRIGDGSAELSWKITGTDESGDAWQLRRSDLYSSEFDISYEALNDIVDELYRIYSNPFEDIEFTGVHVNASFEDEPRHYTIEKVRMSGDGSNFKLPKYFRADPGGAITTRVSLRSNEPYQNRRVDLHLQIPAGAKRGVYVQLSGGGGSDRGGFFGFEGECFDCGGEGGGRERATTFRQLLHHLRDAAHNNDLTAQLLNSRGRIKWEDLKVLDRVVRGQRSWAIRFKHSGGGGGGGVSGGEPIPSRG